MQHNPNLALGTIHFLIIFSNFQTGLWKLGKLSFNLKSIKFANLILEVLCSLLALRVYHLCRASVEKRLVTNTNGTLFNISLLICFANRSSYVSDKPATVGSLVSLEKVSPKMQSNNNNNNNNNNNPQCNSLKATLSLDPAALAKQPLPYVNVNMTPSHIVETDIESHGCPFTLQAAVSRKILSDNEISC
jgi:hypothetical protein